MEQKKEILKKAWEQIFNGAKINEDSNFFQLGGDSVKAVQLTTWLAQKGLKLDLMSVFTTPTFAGQLAILQETTPVDISQFQQVMNMKDQNAFEQKKPAGQMPQQMCTPEQQQQMCTPQQQQMCTPDTMQQLAVLQQQLTVLQSQLTMMQQASMAQLQMCTPQQMYILQQQMCTPHMQMMPPQGNNGAQAPMAGTAYAQTSIENPLLVNLKAPTVGKPAKSPKEALDAVLISIMGHTLNPEDNFFATGLSSINMLQIITRSAENGYKVTLQEIIENPTIEALSKKMVAGE